MLDLRPFVAADLIEIEVQPSQAELYGEPLVRDAQTGAALEAQELSRTARDGQAVFGLIGGMTEHDSRITCASIRVLFADMDVAGNVGVLLCSRH